MLTEHSSHEDFKNSPSRLPHGREELYDQHREQTRDQIRQHKIGDNREERFDHYLPARRGASRLRDRSRFLAMCSAAVADHLSGDISVVAHWRCASWPTVGAPPAATPSRTISVVRTATR